MKIEDLRKDYDELQVKYGAKELDSIYNGGCEKNPDICFVFMNPTGKNIASDKSWKGRKSPWLGTKNIWKLFYKVDLLSEEIFNKIQEKKPKEWDYEFCDYVYEEIEKNKLFITNLGKCTQIDARPLPDEVLKKYLDLLFKEINIIKPKIIITFGNQVSSIILNKKKIVPDVLTAGSDTIGIRMPANDIALNLINYAGVPIATPSANISGKPSGTNLKDIIKDFEGNVDCFIDDGPSKIGLASTIVKVVDGKVHILRQGSISIDEINSAIK